MSINDYRFNNMTQINNDTCALNQRNVQNSQVSNYMVENYYPLGCKATRYYFDSSK